MAAAEVKKHVDLLKQSIKQVLEDYQVPKTRAELEDLMNIVVRKYKGKLSHRIIG